jgi:hypothetical protein
MVYGSFLKEKTQSEERWQSAAVKPEYLRMHAINDKRLT